jgi:predicted ABC-type ATPase
VITAGAPGSGKTTVLEQDREGENIAYMDPDAICLKRQELTYLADIASHDGSPESRLEAYNKWRPASNAAAHIILGNLIREKCAFDVGTTSSSPMTYKFFEFLKSQGYEIKLLHIIAPDDVRIGSI